MKICTQCGEKLPLAAFRKYVGRSSDGYRPLCKRCQRTYERQWRMMHKEQRKLARTKRREKERIYRQAYDAQRRGYLLLMEAKRRSYRKNLPFDLDQHVSALEQRVQRQICEMTGLPLDLHAKGTQWNSPSLDRIQPQAGYTYRNIRVVCFAMNAAMGQWGENKLREIMSAWLERK